MISFECDYLEGCHGKILEALTRTNMDQEPGYGADSCTASAVSRIRQACGHPEASVWFLTGGTQTNQVVTDTMLAPFEGVLSAASGHVNVHEAGAIEYTGHKVLALPSHQGKVAAEDVRQYVRSFHADSTHDHMVFPGMVYISHPTEYGTLYTAAELAELSAVCHENHLALYMDGARLGYGLAAYDTDVTLPLIADLCDAFYIGGTKVGALCGEALVFPRDNAPAHFMTQLKQHGALNAKGRLIGVQFDTLFTDGLYMELGRHAIEMAEEMKQVFHEAQLPFWLESPTNQQFLILENGQLSELGEKVGFGYWDRYDETHTVVRFATSWATSEAAIDELSQIIHSL